MATKDGELACSQGFGKTFKEDGAWRAKHELKCKGKVQLRGRIERLAARAGRSLVPVREAAPTKGYQGGAIARPVARPRVSDPRGATLAVAAVATAATDTAMDLTIAGLLARRQQIDVAIAALEALRA